MAVIGIRREEKSIWERRTPLIPDDVKRLVDQGVRLLVQRSDADAEFAAAGAELVEDIDVADVILGAKEVPIDEVARNKTYFIFSHTMIGQPYDMPLLRRLLDQADAGNGARFSKHRGRSMAAAPGGAHGMNTVVVSGSGNIAALLPLALSAACAAPHTLDETIASSSLTTGRMQRGSLG